MSRLDRRQFLVRSSLAALGCLAGARLAAQAPANPPAPTVTFTPLRRGVGLFSGRGGTMGWLVNEAGVVAVDTQFPDTARLFVEQLPGRGDRGFDCVFNTHHHADHTSGNGVLRPLAQRIVAHEKVPDLQRAAAAQRQLGEQTVADTLFAESWSIDVGDETLSARYFGPAHTGGDSVILFEQANVVHMGDLMFNRLYPVIDRPSGARIAGWIRILEQIARDYPADAIYIYGHGNPRFGVHGGRDDLLVMRDYLSGLLEHAQKELAAGRSPEEIATLENLPGFPDFHQPRPNRLASNLAVACAELTEAG